MRNGLLGFFVASTLYLGTAAAFVGFCPLWHNHTCTHDEQEPQPPQVILMPVPELTPGSNEHPLTRPPIITD